jgi:hypothetical protein
MSVRVPSVPWERAAWPAEVMQLVRRCLADGYDSRDKLTALIAVYGLDWRAQDFALNWSARGLAVLALVDGCLSPEGEKGAAFDICRALRRRACRWRRTEPTHAFWADCEVDRWRLAHAARQLWPTPADPGALQRSCDIAAAVMKAQHAFDVLLAGPKTACEPAPPEFEKWLDSQITIGRQTQSARNPDVERLYLGAELYPGEEDAHARAANGVFSPNGLDVAETQRPHVAFDALVQRLADFDTAGACGALYLHPVSALVKKQCKFDWARHNLFVDIQLSSEHMTLLPLRRNPWILLLCNTYYVRHPSAGRSYFTTDSRAAAHMWFKLFWDDGDEDFFDGEEFYSMLSIPPSCPLSRARVKGIEDEEDEWD